jgi:hypothetical protein
LTDAVHTARTRCEPIVMLTGGWTEEKRNDMVFHEVSDYGQHIYGGNETG